MIEVGSLVTGGALMTVDLGSSPFAKLSQVGMGGSGTVAVVEVGWFENLVRYEGWKGFCTYQLYNME